VRSFMLTLLFFAAHASFVQAASHTFETGRLINVGTADVFGPHVIFTVQVGDIVYTLKGGRVNVRTKDYGQGLIVGDPVKASIEGQSVVIQKQDGKELKFSVMKRERAEAR